MALSGAGFGSLDAVMQWTAYRMSIVWFLHSELEKDRARSRLALHAMAARGEAKQVNKFIKGEE